MSHHQTPKFRLRKKQAPIVTMLVTKMEVREEPKSQIPVGVTFRPHDITKPMPPNLVDIDLKCDLATSRKLLLRVG
jgi:hypothetical protein